MSNNPYETDAQKVMRLREENSFGLDDAVRAVKRDRLRKAICEAETVRDLRVLLLEAFPALDDGAL